MALRLRCPRCGSSKYWIIRRAKRRCARCRYEWRPFRLPLHLAPRQWRQLLGWFLRGVSSAVIAQETGLDRQRVLRALTRLRQAMAQEVARLSKEGFSAEEVSLHEFGGARYQRRHKPRDGQRKADEPKIPVLCNNGKVWIQVAPEEATKLLGLGTEVAKIGSLSGPEGERYFGHLGGASYMEQHVPRESDAARRQHNRLKAFLAYVKRRLGGRGGIRRERMPLYIAEFAWRYNHRHLPHKEQVEHLLRLLRRDLFS